MSALRARPASQGRSRESSHHDTAMTATTTRLTWPNKIPTKTGSSAAAPMPWNARLSPRPGAARYQMTMKAAASTPVQIHAATA